MWYALALDFAVLVDSYRFADSMRSRVLCSSRFGFVHASTNRNICIYREKEGEREAVEVDWHGIKHTDFLLLQFCWIAEFWTLHGSEWIMIDSCVSKHAADSQAITAAWTMNMDAVTIVSRHTEKAYAFPYLHASVALMCWHNEVARWFWAQWARLDVTGS